MVIEPNARDFLGAFFRHKWAFALTFVLVTVLGVGYTATRTVMYRSDEQVVVRFGDNVVPDLSRNTQPVQIVPDQRRSLVLANAEIMRSPLLLRMTIDHFGLANVYPALADKTMNPEQAIELAVQKLGTDLLVDPGEKGDVINLSLLNHDRHQAQAMLQYLTDEYKRREAAVYSDPEIGFQKSEVDKALVALKASQADLEGFKRQDSIVDFDTEVQNLLKQRGEMAETLNASQARLSEAQQRRTALEAQLKQIPPTVAGPSGERYRGADDAQTRLSDLRIKEQNLLATYKPNSPIVQQLHQSVVQAEEDSRRAQASGSARAVPTPNPVFQTLQTDYMHAIGDIRAGTESVQVVQTGLDALNKRLDDLNRRHEGLVERTRSVQIAEDTYRALASHYNDSMVTNALKSQNIYRAAVLTAPNLPFKPARPRVLLMSAATLITATILAFLVVFVLELMDSRFRTPMQVISALDLPVLAAIGDGQRRNNYLRLT